MQAGCRPLIASVFLTWLTIASSESADRLPFHGFLPEYKLKALEPEGDPHPNDVYYDLRPSPAPIPPGFEVRYPSYKFSFAVPKDPEGRAYIIAKKGEAREEEKGHHHHHHGDGHHHHGDIKEMTSKMASGMTSAPHGGAMMLTAGPNTAGPTQATVAPSTDATVAPSVPPGGLVSPAPTGAVPVSTVESVGLTGAALNMATPTSAALILPPGTAATLPASTVPAPVPTVSPVGVARRPPPHFRPPFSPGGRFRPSPFRPSHSSFPTRRPQHSSFSSAPPSSPPSPSPPPSRPPFPSSHLTSRPPRPRTSFRALKSQALPSRPPALAPPTISPAGVAPTTPSVLDRLKQSRRRFPPEQYRVFPGGFVRFSTFSALSG